MVLNWDWMPSETSLQSLYLFFQGQVTTHLAAVLMDIVQEALYPIYSVAVVQHMHLSGNRGLLFDNHWEMCNSNFSHMWLCTFWPDTECTF